MADLEITTRGSAVWARINRPGSLNAITTALKTDLLTALDEAEKNSGTTVFVLTGTGRAFCAGADTKELDAVAADESMGSSLARVELTQRFVDRCRTSRLAVITSVNGIAAGGGVSLALAGDVILAAESARFSLLFGRRGLVPDGGLSRTLVDAVGRRRALALSLTCADIQAPEAAAVGLVDEVVPDEELHARTEALCIELHRSGRQTVALTKRVFAGPADSDYAVEALAQAISLTRGSSLPD